MTFDELVQQVIIKTNRPSMTYTTSGGTGEIPAAIGAVTLALHTWQGHFFDRDRQTSLVTFNTPGYLQTIDTSQLLRYRKLSFIRKWDPAIAAALAPTSLLPALSSFAFPNPALALLKLITPDDLFDPTYGLEKQDVAYTAGDNIAIKSSTSLNYAIMGWFQFPNIATGQYSSWIANSYPYAIIYGATSSIYSDTGQQDMARALDSQVGHYTQHRNALLMSESVTAGF